MCIRDRGVAGNGVRMMENGDKWRVPYLLYADDLVLCGESEESLRELVERFGRVCKTRGLEVNVDKSKVMVVSEDSPQCEVMLDDEQLEQVSEFKYLGYVLSLIHISEPTRLLSISYAVFCLK